MKKTILLIFGFLLMTNYAGAQLLDNFDTPGSLGIFKDAKWGTASSPSITDSIYQAADPSGKSAGVMAVAFDLKGYNQHNAVIAQSALNPNRAQQITYWIYIPLNSGIPDSLVFGLWWQVNGNWTWNEFDYYAKDIPKGKWYPLSAAILDSSIADPANDGFISGHVLGGFGIQWNNGKDTTSVWKGNVYIDNVSLIGAEPTNFATFSSGLQGFGIPWTNGWVDSVAYYSGIIGDSAGVLQWKLINGSAATGGGAIGIQPSTAYSALTQNFLVFWVYVDNSFPDTAHIQSWAQDNNTWSWPSPRGITDYYGGNIPRNVWYPLYFNLSQASVADTVSGSQVNPAKYPLGKFGLQVYGTTTWAGSIYVRSVQFIDSVVQSAPSWVAADFEKPANGIQSFYIPSANSSETLARVKDTQTSDGTYVLQATVDFPQTSKFIVKRDSIPLLDASNSNLFATQVTFGAYFESMTLGALVDFAIDGPATGNKWVQVESALNDTALKVNQWNTLSINLDALVLAGTVNPAKLATIAVQVYYPGDTTKWSGKILFDNLVFTGINQPNELPTPVLSKSSVITEFKLYNNYPNPFNPSTVIKYDLPGELNVTLKVYDILGREVAALVNNQKQAAGSYSISFDASKYASGVYIYKITAGSYIKAFKMMLIK
jgi:hypothetical protein